MFTSKSNKIIPCSHDTRGFVKRDILVLKLEATNFDLPVAQLCKILKIRAYYYYYLKLYC